MFPCTGSPLDAIFGMFLSDSPRILPPAVALVKQARGKAPTIRRKRVSRGTCLTLLLWRRFRLDRVFRRRNSRRKMSLADDDISSSQSSLRKAIFCPDSPRRRPVVAHCWKQFSWNNTFFKWGRGADHNFTGSSLPRTPFLTTDMVSHRMAAQSSRLLYASLVVSFFKREIFTRSVCRNKTSRGTIMLGEESSHVSLYWKEGWETCWVE